MKKNLTLDLQKCGNVVGWVTHLALLNLLMFQVALAGGHEGTQCIDTGNPAYYPQYGEDIHGMAVADFVPGNDGDEIVIAGQSSDSVRILINDGKGSYNSSVIGSASPFLGSQSIVADDFNNDGKPDVAVVGNGVELLLNRSDENTVNFETSRTIISRVEWWFMAAVSADINHDQNADLVITTNRVDRGQQLTVLIGDGQGRFERRSFSDGYAVLFQGRRTLALSDMNADGHLDAVFVPYNANPTATAQIVIMHGDGEGNFTTAPVADLPPTIIGDSARSIAVADFDHDGTLDIATGTYLSREILVYLRSDNGHRFENARSFPSNGVSVGSLLVFDINNDALMDLVAGFEGPQGRNRPFILWGQASEDLLSTPTELDYLPGDNVYSSTAVKSGRLNNGEANDLFFLLDDNAGVVALNNRCTEGDLNCDGEISNGDIESFVLAITDPDAYVSSYPECQILNADLTNDGLADNGDIDTFVALLLGL